MPPILLYKYTKNINMPQMSLLEIVDLGAPWAAPNLNNGEQSRTVVGTQIHFNEIFPHPVKLAC